MRILFCIALILPTLVLGAPVPYKAVVTAPVIDLVGSPLGSFYPNQEVSASYAALPVSEGKKVPELTCPRIHQLLFNDVVTVTETTALEARIDVTQAFYTVGASAMPRTGYWTLKKHLMPLNALSDTNKIPAPTDFRTDLATTTHQPTIITLKHPFYDSVTKRNYSAGTRFVTVHIKKRVRKHRVWLLDPITKQFVQATIPKKLTSPHRSNPAQRTKQFVALLKEWAHQKNGFIPYVWGGCSFITTQHTPFARHTTTVNNKPASYFAFTGDTSAPKIGMDCANIIVRAAQICCIPFYCKNTTTIKQQLTPIQPGESVAAGDIILIKGHVMVVADIAKNTLIEAASYFYGYGKVHEIPLHKSFQGIHTYQDLLDVHHKKKRITRLDSKGNTTLTFPDCTILKLASVFTNHK